MKLKALPLRARILLLAVVAGGAACVGLRVPQAIHWTHTDVVNLVALAVAICVCEQFSVPLRLRSETLNFTLADAAWAAGLVLAHSSVLTVALMAGVLAGQLIKR